MLRTSRVLAAGALVLGSVTGALAANVTGAGASFPAPLYSKWAAAYAQETQNKVNYQSIGSSGGVAQVKAKTVDFGATDDPLNQKELDAANLVQFPTVIGGVVPVVNVPGVAAGQLVLDGKVLGDIYLGKVTKWSDAAIKALNPSLKLPDSPIAVVRRADGSGTSFVFTNYLSKVNADWKAKVGESKNPNWPVGTGGKGNEGVSAFVKQLPGTIGYVEYAYAKQNKLAFVKMKNAAGQVVAPAAASFNAAGAAAQWPADFGVVLTNQAGAAAWPISSATFVLVPKSAAKPEQTAEVLKFFDWAYGAKGDAMALGLDYVPMPDAVVAKVKAAWAQVKK